MRVQFNPAEFKEPATYLSHDQLIGCILKLYPDAVHGQDFIVGHMVEPGSAKQISAAQILAWNLPQDPPVIDTDIAPVWAQHGAAIKADMLARDVRGERTTKLAEADVLVNIAHDSKDDTALAKAVAYRQALRDITKQPDFPHSVSWPVKP